MNLLARYGDAAVGEVGGGAGIAHDGDVEAEVDGGPDCGVDAHRGHHPGDDEFVDAGALQPPLEVGAEERVRCLLDDDRLLPSRGDAIIVGETGRPRLEIRRVRLVPGVLDMDDRLGAGAKAGEDRRGGVRGAIASDERVAAVGEVVALDVDEQQSPRHDSHPTVTRSDRSGTTLPRMLIRGESVAGDGPTLAVENPYTEATIESIGTASEAQVDAAVAAASEAAPMWAAIPAVERAEMLHEVATRLRAKTEVLAETMTLEGGKPLIENRDEVGWTAAAFDYYAELGRDAAGRVIPPIESTQLAIVVKEPIGVVACIVPWNYPLLLLAWKLAPALAAGNATVCKPSELTPLATLQMLDCFDHLPDGAVNVLVGDGGVGARIVADSRVGCVAFTGSVATGQRIATVCAERIARVNLELGGKDPFIVCADVASEPGALEIAARGGAWAAYLNAGQVCTSAERFYVERAIYDDYLDAFVAHTETLRLGDPLEPSTDIGPMVSAPQRDKVIAQLDQALAAGALIATGGNDGDQSHGHFLAPTVVTGAHAHTDLLAEETFGPVAPIVPVDSLEEAIALANGTRFGLGANVYTRDLATAVRCMRELKAGTVWINDPLTDNDAGPFGGFKQSGLGRELGREGLEAFQETKHVHMETRIARKEWWYPYGG